MIILQLDILLRLFMSSVFVYGICQVGILCNGVPLLICMFSDVLLVA